MYLPIGSIVAWDKSYPNTPPLPSNWAELNGQVLDNPSSPYHGQTLRNWNGDGRFLRGGATSGVEQDDAMQGFKTKVNTIGNYGLKYGTYGAGSSGAWTADTAKDGVYSGGPVSDGSHGTPRVADETRPKNASVVWIMKVAEVDEEGDATMDTWHVVGEASQPAWSNNEWGAAGAYSLMFKFIDGKVYLHGYTYATKAGSAKGMFTLPVGYRPSKELRLYGVAYFNGSEYADSFIVIKVDGTVEAPGPCSASDHMIFKNLHFIL